MLELEWSEKEKFPTFLEVDMEFVTKSNKAVKRTHFSRCPWEVERSPIELGAYRKQAKKQAAKERDDGSKDVGTMKRLRRWEKFANFESVLPDKRQFKFESEDQGAFRIKFSNMGRYLAACCTMGSGRTIIKIFDIEKDSDHESPHIASLAGHQNLIHDIDWSYKDKYICTASSDCSVKVWELRNLLATNTEKLNYDGNKHLFFECSIQHPSFVYGSKFHPVKDDRSLFIATICYDGKVRIFRVDTPLSEQSNYPDLLETVSIFDAPSFTHQNVSAYDGDENLEDETLRLIMNPQDDAKDNKVLGHKHPNAMTFDGRETLYVGDSTGRISIWRVMISGFSVTVANHYVITHKEIEGDQINEIIVHPESHKQIYVQSRDNCIRLIDYGNQRGTRINKRFFGAKCSNQKVQCAISPDGQYVVAGSETGQPIVWEEHMQEK